MNTGNAYGCFLSSPRVGMPSGRLIGHTQAKKVEVVSAKAPAPSRIGAGADVQNLFRHIFKVNISSTKYLSKV